MLCSLVGLKLTAQMDPTPEKRARMQRLSADSWAGQVWQDQRVAYVTHIHRSQGVCAAAVIFISQRAHSVL